MKIPKKLKIGGHIYTIRLVSPNGLETSDVANINRTTNTITLINDMSISQIEENLIHEIFHAINGNIDHILLESLAHQFHQVLRDNKMLR